MADRKLRETTTTLETLRQMCSRGASNLGAAAAEISDPQMRQELELLSRRHGDFSNDLRNLLHLLKPVPDHAAQSDNTRKGSGKTSAGAADVRHLLAVCYSSEQALAEAYAEALHRHVLPVEIEPLVESQWRAIEFARDRIRRLTAERRFEPERDSLMHHT